MTPDTPVTNDTNLESPTINGIVLAHRDRSPSPPTTNGDLGPPLPPSYMVILRLSSYTPPSTASSAPTPTSTANQTTNQPLTLSDWTLTESAHWRWPPPSVSNASTEAVKGSAANSTTSTIPGEQPEIATTIHRPAPLPTPPLHPSPVARDPFELTTAGEYHTVTVPSDGNDDDEAAALRLEAVPRTETEMLIAQIGAHSDGEIGLELNRMIEGLLDRQREEMYASRWRAGGVEVKGHEAAGVM